MNLCKEALNTYTCAYPASTNTGKNSDTFFPGRWDTGKRREGKAIKFQDPHRQNLFHHHKNRHFWQKHSKHLLKDQQQLNLKLLWFQVVARSYKVKVIYVTLSSSVTPKTSSTCASNTSTSLAFAYSLVQVVGVALCH